jgi:hypothetical protein
MAAALAAAGGTLLSSPFARSALKSAGGFITRHGLKFLRAIPSYLRTAGAAASRVAGFAKQLPLTNSQKSAALGTALEGGRLLGQKLTGGHITQEDKRRFKNVASENFDRFVAPTDFDTAESIGETGRRVRDTYRSVRDHAPEYARAAFRGAQQGAAHRMRRRYGRGMDNVYNAMPYYENVHHTYAGGGSGRRRRTGPHSRGPYVEEMPDSFTGGSGGGHGGYTVEEPDD